MAGNPPRELLTRSTDKTATADQAEEIHYGFNGWEGAAARHCGMLGA